MTALIFNKKKHTVDDEGNTPLLWVIRDTTGYTGTKLGCGVALCGACTVHLNGDNYYDYPMVHLAEAPHVDVQIVQNTENPGGVGEPGTSPLAPAVANALFAATGTRVRSLPLVRHAFTA